ncbi:MAG TPA: DnaJ domain-containing protein, partial [Thermoanaerobaculia bacterium]|nr:DnaJ domain-containing protein [Thermoanaerobaculia bacterium]
MPSPGVSEEELRLFDERIARSLKERPQDISYDAHREWIAALVREMGEATHYRFLGIEPTASNLEIHEAYERTARMAHRGNAKRVGLEGREDVLQVLFERATEAYLTLVDRDRRKRYDREMGPRLWERPEALPVVTRREEAARLFDRAKALAAAEELHPAVELLREAVRTTPKAEYISLLGMLEAKNPRWLRSAEQNLQRALNLGAQEPGLVEALSEVREKLALLAAGRKIGRDDDDAE